MAVPEGADGVAVQVSGGSPGASPPGWARPGLRINESVDVDAALREGLKPSQGAPAEPHAVGNFSIDYAQRRLTVARESVGLLTAEYATLQ